MFVKERKKREGKRKEEEEEKGQEGRWRQRLRRRRERRGEGRGEIIKRDKTNISKCYLVSLVEEEVSECLSYYYFKSRKLFRYEYNCKHSMFICGLVKRFI
jgi:hypothetical protein